MTSYGLNTDQIINIEVKHMSEIEEKIITTVKEKFRLMSVNLLKTILILILKKIRDQIIKQ